AVELEQPAGAGAGALLHEEMAVLDETLRAREPVFLVIDEFAPRLREAGRRVLDEQRHSGLQPVRRRAEIGVEHGDEGRVGEREPIGAGAGLESLAVRSAHVFDVDALGLQLGGDRGGAKRRVVGRIIEKLDAQPVLWPVELSGAAQGLLGDEGLVEHRNLQEHMRQLVVGERYRGPVAHPPQLVEEEFADDQEEAEADCDEREPAKGYNRIHQESEKIEHLSPTPLLSPPWLKLPRPGACRTTRPPVLRNSLSPRRPGSWSMREARPSA